MAHEVKVILDLSDEVKTLLYQQSVDLYEEIRLEIPSVRLEVQSDPIAPMGSRDAATIIVVTTSLITALTPIIIRILDRFTPPNRNETWVVEEIENHLPDGSITFIRKRVLSSKEQRQYEQYKDKSKPVIPTNNGSEETKR